jgi:tetratricopeptide (TPR) repeat protein
MRRLAGSRALAAAVVGAATLVAFAPILGNGFVDWDDYGVLRDNPHFRGLGVAQIAWAFDTYHMGHYQPLTWLSFGADYLLWGMDPRGFHATSLLLHALNAALAFLLIEAILARASAPGSESTRRLAAMAGALFFALHPLRVEVVAWAAVRGHLIASALALLATLLYVRRGRSSPAALALFGASLLAKATAVTLPVVLLLLDHFVLHRLARERPGAVLREKLPWLGLVGLFLLLALSAQAASGALLGGGAVEHGVGARLLQAAYGLCFYLTKTALPVGLAALYPIDQRLAPPEAVFYACALAVVAITAACLAARRRWPGLLAAWLAYAVLVSPVLGLAQSGFQIAADRYTYLACLPFAVLLAWGLARTAARPAARRWLAPAVGALLALLAALAWQQTRVWRDSVSLWERAASVHPESGLVAYYRGNALRGDGRLRDALAAYDHALALGLPLRASAHTNRGLTRGALGERGRALEDLDEAIRLAPSAQRLMNRGSARLQADAAGAEPDLAGAIADWSEALRLDPDLVDAWHARGAAYQALGRRRAAADDYRQALARSDDGWAGRADVRRRLTALEADAARSGAPD